MILKNHKSNIIKNCDMSFISMMESTDIPVKDISKLNSILRPSKLMDLPISQYKAMYIVTYRTYSHHYDYYHYPEIKYIV